MGGKEGTRGYLYQAFTAVLEALNYKSWDYIHIELPTNDDKVDIALESNNQITMVIQVKSSTVTFDQSEIRRWICELIQDYSCEKYKLYLIGNCNGPAQDFCNAVNDFSLGNSKECETQKFRKAIKGFDISLIQNREVTISMLPFQVDNLISIAKHALYEYSYSRGGRLSPPQLEFVLSAITEEQMFCSITSGKQSRDEFDCKLREKIALLAKGPQITRETIGIISFERGASDLLDTIPRILDLRDKFSERSLKEGLTWDNDIGKTVTSFLTQNTAMGQFYQLALATHGSIAFAAGRTFDSKMGRDVCPIQNSPAPQLWDDQKRNEGHYATWEIENIVVSRAMLDTALVLDVGKNILKEVKQYVEAKELPIGRVVNCKLGESADGAFFAVKDGRHALMLAKRAVAAITEQSQAEQCGNLHIFFAAPNALMFYLGTVSMVLGKCTLYEFDFEKRTHGTYEPSLHFA